MKANQKLNSVEKTVVAHSYVLEWMEKTGVEKRVLMTDMEKAKATAENQVEKLGPYGAVKIRHFGPKGGLLKTDICKSDVETKIIPKWS